MAEAHGSTRMTDSVSTSTPGRPEAGRAEERRDRMQEQGREIAQRAQDLATQGKEAATEYYEQGRERVQEWQQQLEHQVREKPLQSLLIAAGIGLLIGLLKRR